MRIFLLLLFFVFLIYTPIKAQTNSHISPRVVRVKLKSLAYQQVLHANPILKTKGNYRVNELPVVMGLSNIDALNKAYKVYSITRVFPYAGKHEAKQQLHGLHLWYDIQMSKDENIYEVIEKYKLISAIEIAEPVFNIKYIGSDTQVVFEKGVSASDIITNDPEFTPRQWHYYNTGQSNGKPGVDIRLNKAWEITTGSPNVIVAVVDGGVDFNHEDLKDNMWVNEAERDGNLGEDDDDNGYIDDKHGFNFVDGYGYNPSDPKKGPAPIVPHDHGTHVAGTVAAVNNNGKGVSGVAGGFGYSQKGARIMTCQTLVNEKKGAYIGAAIVYAANNGAVILQNSWGFDDKEGTQSQSVLDAIRYFIKYAGTDDTGLAPRQGTPMMGGIVIFAAGNKSSDGYWYPARYDEVMAVASVNHNGQLASYSNYGGWVEISAPGGETNTSKGGVYSTLPNNQYGYMQGTSMACPHVSGVAALILSKFGSETYTPDLLWNRLVNTTSSLKEYEPYRYEEMGSGLLNAEEALQDERPNLLPPNPIDNLTFSNIKSTSVVLKWTAPFDIDSDKATSYKVAVSKNPINSDADFASAAIQKKIDNALPASSEETYLLTSLMPITDYYVAIRSLDAANNISNISNVITFKTSLNQSPIVGEISPISMRDIGGVKSFDLTMFSDPDEDELVFVVNNPQPAVATAIIQDNKIFITPVKEGNVTFKITATDPYSEKVSGDMEITILKNAAPVSILTDTTMVMKPKEVKVFQLNNYFSDTESDNITYVLSQDLSNNIISATLTGAELKVTALKKGDVSFAVIATDQYGANSKFTINVSVSTIAPDNNNEILVYPVPVESILTYAFTLDKTSDVEIRIYSSDGRLVYHKTKANFSTGSQSETIDVSSWAKGMYIIQYLVDGKSVDAKKIVK